MTKTKQDLPPSLAPVPYKPQPNVLEVMIYTYDSDNPVFGHCLKDRITISDKAILVNWVDGGFTYAPMDSVIKIHWQEVSVH
jgi:hypothetical protein